jgi:dienelactone hydrolase
MLFVPKGAGPYPAAIIIHGSGTSQRNNGWYLTLTKYLQDNGILVLLPDKRGSEKSEGDWYTSSLDDLATDTVAAIEFIKLQEMVEVSYIGVIGMSQGGRIAPLAADKSQDISYLINVVGGATPAFDALYYEENYNLREMGFLPGISNVMALGTTPLLINVTDKTYWGAVGNFDPLPYWNKVNIPALHLLGEQDTNVPTERSAELLKSLNRPNINVIVYSGSGHALEDPVERGNSIFREDAMKDILDFIKSTSSQGDAQ